MSREKRVLEFIASKGHQLTHFDARVRQPCIAPNCDR